MQGISLTKLTNNRPRSLNFVIEKAGALASLRDMISFLTKEGRNKMPILRAASVSVEPMVLLSSWRVLQVEDGSRHLSGSTGFAEGRVSSAVISIDYVMATAVTQSGRMYQLVGKPGPDADADYVWERWTAIYKVASWVDVTSEAWEQMQAHQQP